MGQMATPPTTQPPSGTANSAAPPFVERMAVRPTQSFLGQRTENASASISPPPFPDTLDSGHLVPCLPPLARPRASLCVRPKQPHTTGVEDARPAGVQTLLL